MLIVETHATSHVGRIRKGNEDNFLLLDLSKPETCTSSQAPESLIIESRKFEIDEKGIVLAVSDGMGGALAGEVASKMAVETISKAILEEDPDKTISPDSFGDNLVGRL